MTQQDWTGESLLEFGRSFQRSQPLLAAAELGVFETLAGGGKPASQVAGELETDPRATELLLNALTALGLLDKNGTAFSIPDRLVPLLVGSDETSVLPMIRHHATCAHRWDTLATVVRSGRPVRDETSSPRSETELRAFIQAMHVVGRDVADGIVAAMGPERFRRALDVGGGSRATAGVRFDRSGGDRRRGFLRRSPAWRSRSGFAVCDHPSERFGSEPGAV